MPLPDSVVNDKKMGISGGAPAVSEHPSTQGSAAAPGAPSQDFLSGLSHHQRRQLPEAERFYRQALDAFPTHFDSLHHLGLVLLETGRAGEAETLLRRALERRPDSPQARNSLGAILRALGRHEEALGQFRESVTLRPDDIRSLDNLCGLLVALNRAAEAIPYVERAVAADTKNAELHHMLGGLLFGLGRPEEARACFETALTRQPRSGKYYRCLADVKRFDEGDAHLTGMEALARADAALTPDERAALHFALGKALDDLGRHNESFEHLLKANRITRTGTAYDERAALAAFDRLKAVFTPALMRAKAGLGDPSRVPVFIVGMPRSGTSLIEQILASHPEVAGAGESTALERAFGAQFPLNRFPAIVPALTGEQLRRLGADYLRNVRIAGEGATRITNKLPANFMLAGLIHLALPNARIIHVVRDAVDTCLSCFAQQFGGGDPYLYDLAELGRHYRAYRGLMEHWRNVLPEGAMMEVTYEAVVDDLEGETRRMLAHCDLEWDARCLAFDKTERGVWTASAGQVRKPLFRSSIGRRRPDASLLRPLIDGLGPYA